MKYTQYQSIYTWYIQARRHGWGRGGGRPTCPEGGGARWGGQVPLWWISGKGEMSFHRVLLTLLVTVYMRPYCWTAAAIKQVTVHVHKCMCSGGYRLTAWNVHATDWYWMNEAAAAAAWVSEQAARLWPVGTPAAVSTLSSCLFNDSPRLRLGICPSHLHAIAAVAITTCTLNSSLMWPLDNASSHEN